jgi:hypothetical protein
MLFAALGGYVAQRIGTAAWKPAIALAVVIAVGAIASILGSPGTESRWSQWSAVILMAPSALIGGWLAMRSSRGAREL